MGIPVMIMGFSGSGKSTSMRNFAADEIALVNVNKKPLPFKTKFKNLLNSDDYGEITAFLKSTDSKKIIIDDAQYLMLNEYMRRSKETGFQKYSDIAKNFWELVSLVGRLKNDVVVYFLQHIEQEENGRIKPKTVGKLLDEKINLEGMFTIVMRTVIHEKNYCFATRSDGSDACKTPLGLFDEMYIGNDLKKVDDSIRRYYDINGKSMAENLVEKAKEKNIDVLEEMGFEEITVPPEIPPGIPKKLAELMDAYCVTEEQIRQAVASLGIYSESTQISAYDPEFVQEMLINQWVELLNKIEDLKVPF